MTQQPILTADEVLEILEKEAFAQDEGLRNDLRKIAKPFKLAFGKLDDPYLIIPILDYCATFLRNKGIYVYYCLSDEINGYNFVAGECGRILEELCKLEEFLHDLEWFVETNERKLPPEVVAEKKKLDHYSWKLCEELIFPLEDAYIDNDKATIEALLKEVPNIVKEVKDYLESIKYLQHLYAIETYL